MLLAFQRQFSIWWDILRADFAMGYEKQAPSCSEDSIECSRTYPSGLRHADCRDAERTQSYHEQYGWFGVQLASRHACPTTGGMEFAVNLLSHVN